MTISHADKVQARADLLMDVCGLNFSAALKRASLEIRKESLIPEILYSMSDIYRITDALGVDRWALQQHIKRESRDRFFFIDNRQGVRKTFKANREAKPKKLDLTFSDWKRVVTWTRMYCDGIDQPFPHLAGDAGAWYEGND